MIANKPYGSKADIYSFGIVVAEMLIGRYPYGDLNLSVQDFEKAILAVRFRMTKFFVLSRA